MPVLHDCFLFFFLMLAGGVYCGCAVKRRSVLAQLDTAGTSMFFSIILWHPLTLKSGLRSHSWHCLSGCKLEEWFSRNFNLWDLSLPKGKACCPCTLTSNQSWATWWGQLHWGQVDCGVKAALSPNQALARPCPGPSTATREFYSHHLETSRGLPEVLGVFMLWKNKAWEILLVMESLLSHPEYWSCCLIDNVKILCQRFLLRQHVVRRQFINTFKENAHTLILLKWRSSREV